MFISNVFGRDFVVTLVIPDLKELVRILEIG